MTRKKRGCLVVFVVALLLAAAAVVGTVAFLPGDLHLGDQSPARIPDAEPAAAPVSGSAAPSPSRSPGAWMTYLVPNDILQAEVKKAFPISTNVVDVVRLQLDQPSFIADPDDAFLRVRLVVEVRMLESGQRLPGTAVVRTQLRYDRGMRRVMLRNAQMVDLSFSGPTASAASALQPVLTQALAAEMEGYVIFEVPADGLWWLKTGVGFVRDVYVDGGRVAVGLGP